LVGHPILNPVLGTGFINSCRRIPILTQAVIVPQHTPRPSLGLPHVFTEVLPLSRLVGPQLIRSPGFDHGESAEGGIPLFRSLVACPEPIGGLALFGKEILPAVVSQHRGEIGATSCGDSAWAPHPRYAAT
jgi:hypothetical protein